MRVTGRGNPKYLQGTTVVGYDSLVHESPSPPTGDLCPRREVRRQTLGTYRCATTIRPSENLTGLDPGPLSLLRCHPGSRVASGTETRD